MSISSYITPVLIVIVLIYALFKKRNVYQDFIEGTSEALPLVKGIFPYLIAIFLMVEIYKASGLSFYLSKALSPIMMIFGIPTELCELVLIKPFSGSASLVLLNDVYLTYGVDSYIGKCASVIMSSSETVFYISSIYFSKIKGKGLIKGIIISLIAGNIGAGIGCQLCRFF